MKKPFYLVMLLLCLSFCFGCATKEEADQFTSDVVDTINEYISNAAQNISDSVSDEYDSVVDSVKQDLTENIRDNLEDTFGEQVENLKEEAQQNIQNETYVDYYFRSKKLLEQHYDKHGRDMGFKSKEDYRKAASDVINNPNALHKIEAEDGDYVYYIEDTNEFVILSTDGYIRTYFLPDQGKKYYDRQ